MADALTPSDVIQTCRLPEPQGEIPECLPDATVGWFVGLYMAEGSRSGDTIQISSHVNALERLHRLEQFATAYGGTCRMHRQGGNKATMNLNGPILNGIIDTYITGSGAAGKHLNVRCWQRSDAFLHGVLTGYLSGDGHFDKTNARWRLAFCENDAWASDLRTVCARLGLALRLSRTNHSMNGRLFPGYRGQIRFEKSSHHNAKDYGEVIAIRGSRARKFYDIGVEDEPHLFALASGVLTHNSKQNPMPERVIDRPTRSHEYIFLFSKSQAYYYDHEAIKDRAVSEHGSGNGYVRDERLTMNGRGSDKPWSPGRTEGNAFRGQGHFRESAGGPANREGRDMRDVGRGELRNKRDVWTVNTKPFPGAHFATFPPDLIKPCVLAGSRTGDTILDPFSGAGTTGVVCKEFNRSYIGIEINPEYVELSRRRIAGTNIPLDFEGEEDSHVASDALETISMEFAA